MKKLLAIFMAAVIAVSSLTVCISAADVALRTPVIKVTVVNTDTIFVSLYNASRYELYRSDKKNGTYKKIVTTSNNFFINEGLLDNKDYFYKARAVKTVGGKSTYSGYSNIKTAKTEKREYIKKGVYKVGEDILPGIYTLVEDGEQMSATTFRDKGLREQLNRTTTNNGSIVALVGEYLKLFNCKAYLGLKDKTHLNTKGEGIFLAGKDIPVGEYTIEVLDKTCEKGYVGVFTRNLNKKEEQFVDDIKNLCNIAKNETKTVKLEAGDYIELKSAKIKSYKKASVSKEVIKTKISFDKDNYVNATVKRSANGGQMVVMQFKTDGKDKKLEYTRGAALLFLAIRSKCLESYLIVDDGKTTYSITASPAGTYCNKEVTIDSGSYFEKMDDEKAEIMKELDNIVGIMLKQNPIGGGGK